MTENVITTSKCAQTTDKVITANKCANMTGQLIEYFFIRFKGKRGCHMIMSNKLTKIYMYKRISQKVHNNVQAGFIPQALLNGIYITSGSVL